MTEIPEWVTAIVSKADSDHPNDIEAAVSEALGKIKRDRRFRDVLDALVEKCVQELVYESRCQVNRGLKSEARLRDTRDEPTRVSSVSEGVMQVYESYLNYRIGKKTLGVMTYKDLAAVASSERALRDGHDFNLNVCETVMLKVPDDDTTRVGDRFTDAQIKRIFQRFGRDV